MIIPHSAIARPVFKLRNLALAVAFCAALVAGSFPAGAQPPVLEKPGDVITTAIPQFWPPYFIVKPGEAPTGFGVEMLNAIAARAGYTVNYQVTPTVREAFDLAVEGSTDLMSSVGVVEERRKLLNFTDPIETFVVGLFVRTDTQDIAGVSDLPGRRVAVVIRNVGVRLMRNQPGVESVVFDDVRSALFDLVAGRVDAMVYPVPILRKLAYEIGVDQQIETVGEPLLEVKRAIGVHPSRTEMFQRLSAAVADFTGTPEYQEIYVRWFGRPQSFWTVEKVLMIAGGGFLLIIVGFSLWHYRAIMRMNRALEGRVEQRTTELRQAQADLLRKERLAALGELTGTVAHELRNPLGTVVSACEVIKHKTSGTGIDLKSSLDRAERNIDRCTGIIDDLLDYAQVKEVKRQSTDIGALLREISEEYDIPEPVALDLRLEHADRPVNVDPEQFRRIILNFLDNACQAIEEKYVASDDSAAGKIAIATRATNEGIEIVISDNGAGIPGDIIGHIFEPLFSTKSFGVGLGLPNAQNIVLAHSGTLSVKSEPGAGTDIVVWLPVAAEQALQREALSA